jgi:hypothetical protein
MLQFLDCDPELGISSDEEDEICVLDCDPELGISSDEDDECCVLDCDPAKIVANP